MQKGSVTAPLQEGGVAAWPGNGGSGGSGDGGGGAAAGDWLTRLDLEVEEARPVVGLQEAVEGLGAVDGMEDEGNGVGKEVQDGGDVWGGVVVRHSPADVFVAGAVDLQQAGGAGQAWPWAAGWVVVGVNLTASERLPPLVVGRGALPPLSPGVVSLPLPCVGGGGRPGATLTQWLAGLDRRFLAEGRRVALVVVQGTLNPPAQGLRATTLVPVPRALHPLGGGGLALTLRRHYVQLMQDREGGTGGDAPPDLLYGLLLAWAALTPQHILHAFRTCGAPCVPPAAPTPATPPPAPPPDLHQVWAALATLRGHLAATPHAHHAYGHLAAVHAFCRAHTHTPPDPPCETSL
ncbi:Tigger transposable element-derived protein 4 [Portunus trituberculatus]|uniref:Tigger transposable element-derived protein 4 n=1 Tax=Portunus trituberculatus TaxID=210409 RepID=A0A5B7IDP7_PORTR|nr:Tigger transposable element-derived protein 4 [Portunus trituberculatus]